MLSAMILLTAMVATAPDAAERCTALAVSPVASGLVIDAAEPAAATETLPAYCRVRGTIDPDIGFEARLPIDNWNGKFFQTGCGGFCGRVEPDRESRSNAINYALRRGYAAITTNGGHVGESLGDARWALDNPVAEAVYGHRVLPLTYATGHALVKALYGKEPRYSYFSGCSNGGRLAAVAAQRYPALFDGIVVGYPVLNLSINGGAFGALVLQANTDEAGRRILDSRFAAKLPMLSANAMAQCDTADGRSDGVIADPYACEIDLTPIPDCDARNADTCLTDAERHVVEMWYRGPVTSDGEQIFPGMPPGSERYWDIWYLGNAESPGVGTLLADGYGTYLGFAEDRPGYSALDFDFDKDISELSIQGRIFNALDSDLSAFRDAGGKMIVWHGLADPLVLPQQTRQYYEAVVQRFGAEDSAEFLRYFEAPGLGHCWERPAELPDQMDMLSALEAWVETGAAPDAIALSGRVGGPTELSRGTLLPYPRQAEYVLEGKPHEN